MTKGQLAKGMSKKYTANQKLKAEMIALAEQIARGLNAWDDNALTLSDGAQWRLDQIKKHSDNIEELRNELRAKGW